MEPQETETNEQVTEIIYLAWGQCRVLAVPVDTTLVANLRAAERI